LLHHAVNLSSATADATFETEQTLIDLGININLRDNKGRVPLHYSFVKIKGWNLSTQIDPIETVSSLCGQAGLEIEVADKWNKTPLHYAAQRGSAICTLYILQRGANIESLDIYNNSALGICLLRKHFNYAILLIQKSANVCLPTYNEFPNRLAK
jgi:ankyrin repeat protein